MSIETSAGVATIEVSDAGQPIPEGARERMFEPFARADDDGPIESVGLGLSVSRHVAELMGGSLTYTHSGGRSRFRLTLPAPP